jgi:hypothetical protein
MDADFFSLTQRHLASLITFAEDIGSTLDFAGPSNSENSAPPGDESNPLAALFRASGRLEGLRLRERGLLSSDLLDYVQELAMTFEMEVKPSGPFKLPFLGQSLILERKTLNSLRQMAWEAYHAELFSAYALKSLFFIQQEATPGDAFDILLTLQERNTALNFPDRRREGHAVEKKMDALTHQLAAAQEACTQANLRSRLASIVTTGNELRQLLGI